MSHLGPRTPGALLSNLQEAEQTSGLRFFSLPAGYEKAQALAEYWNASARLDEFLSGNRRTQRKLRLQAPPVISPTRQRR